MFVPNGMATGARVLVNCAVQLGLLAETAGAPPSMTVPASIVAAAKEYLFRTSPTSFQRAAASGSYPRHASNARGEQAVFAAGQKSANVLEIMEPSLPTGLAERVPRQPFVARVIFKMRVNAYGGACDWGWR